MNKPCWSILVLALIVVIVFFGDLFLITLLATGITKDLFSLVSLVLSINKVT